MRYVAVGAIAILCFVSFAAVRAGNADDARRFADANAKVRRAELEKAVEANRKVPGTTPDTEIQRLRLAYVLAALGPDADPAAKMAAQALVAKAELDKALESNRRVAGSVPEVEIQRLKLTYDLAALGPDAEPAARTAALAAVAKADLDKALEANRKVAGTFPESQIEILRTRVEVASLSASDDAARRAEADVKVSKAELQQAIEANRKVPGTVSAEVVDHLRDRLRDPEIIALREEIKSLRKEVQELRKSQNEPRENK